MEHLIEHMGEILLHTLLDTAKLLPFLFLTYLLMEFLEHRSGNAAANWLRRSGGIGPLVGGAMGIVPQCGFSAAASGLYAGRIITAGTLIAVYLSTSDEMLPILISHGAPLSLIFKILGTKLAVGVAAGFAVDAVSRLCRRKSEKKNRRRRSRSSANASIAAVRIILFSLQSSIPFISLFLFLYFHF